LLVGLFTGLWFVLKSLYSWTTKQKVVPVTPASDTAIEANADPLLLK
jgi:lipopolysaccharide biosynthesis protein